AGLHYEIQESELTEAKGASVDMFPDAQWAVIRRENSAIAIKGGHNGEPHNHNDVGSVMYIADGSLLLTDLGAGEYTKEYFGAGRYDNLCCSSLGHSVPIIDEGGQRAGTEYKATEFQQMGDSVTLNMAGAYDLEAEESIRRSVFFREKDGALTIRDVFKLKEGRKSVENLVTPIRPVETEKGFLLEAAGKQYRVTCDSFLSKRVLERTYHNHAGVEETVWMMQWDVMDCTIVIDLY
ncbi:MAG: heparinase II/III family protein, partial [Agathobacter sp.]